MKTNNVIVESLKYIDSNLSKSLTLEKLAMQAGYSECHYTRMFKSIMGISSMDYVKKRRLLKASEKLWQGAKIIDIAMEFGYQSHSGFTKAFKQEFGFSPTFLKMMKLQIDYLGGIIMSKVFLKQIEIHAAKEALYEILIKELQENKIKFNETMLEEVYAFSCEAYDGVKRHSGDEYITHPLNVAIILAGLGAEIHVIAAGLLCDIMVKTGIEANLIQEKLPKKVSDIVLRLDTFNLEDVGANNAEETIMIKLAERLHNMRTIEFMDEPIRTAKARETVNLFLPIVAKMGNERIMVELNDLSSKYA